MELNKTGLTTKARVLVVIPTLGTRNDLLLKTLESVKSQNIAHDIVLIFPLSNRETTAIAQKYNAQMVDDPGGLSSSINAGIAQAKPHHEYISWIGDDDLLMPYSFETAVTALDKNSNAALAFGYCNYIDINDTVLFTSRAGRLAPWIMTWGPNLVPLPGIVFRKIKLNQAGIFDPNNRYSMDLDMLLRLKRLGPFINTKVTLAAFRWHATSTTVTNRKLVIGETEAVKRKYLPKYLPIIAPLWEYPVRGATLLAANRVNKLVMSKQHPIV